MARAEMKDPLLIRAARLRSIDCVEGPIATHVEARHSQARLLAAASHDLRQPLQAIGLWVEILRSESRDDRTSGILAKINETARGVEFVLGSLLDISKLDLGGIRAHPTDFSVSELLERVIATHTPAALSKGLRLRVSSSTAMVHSDPGLLERVLSNFVANAVRYTERGGVLIGCRKRRGCLSIEVWDTGLGIPQDRLQDIFLEFVQLHPTGERNRGAGLGLSIAQRIAALLGHDIGVTSQLARGSCFRIKVPLACSRAPAMLATRSRDFGEDLDVHGAFVVFIDDEQQIREAMQSLLESWGCHVVVGASGFDALAQLDAHLRLPDILIADYRLIDPETGLQAIQGIRAVLKATIPAVIISASPLKPMAGRRRISILSKPVQAGDLKREIARSYSPCALAPNADYRIMGFRSAAQDGVRQQRPASGL